MVDSHRPYFPVASSAAFLSVFTSSSCGQQNKSQFFQGICVILDRYGPGVSYVSIPAYFLVIDKADENTMHILQLPKVFGFFLSV